MTVVFSFIPSSKKTSADITYWNNVTTVSMLSVDADGYYMIRSANDLAYLSKTNNQEYSNGTKTYKYVRLYANIDLADHYWTPMYFKVFLMVGDIKFLI